MFDRVHGGGNCRCLAFPGTYNMCWPKGKPLDDNRGGNMGMKSAGNRAGNRAGIAVGVLWVATLGLLAIGLLLLASLDVRLVQSGREWPGLQVGLARRQMAWIGVGLLLAWTASRVDFRRWRQLAVPFAFALFVLLTVVLIPGVGAAVLGARKWLCLWPLGWLQPSVLATGALVLFMAWWYQMDARRTSLLDWIPVAAMLGFAALVFVEPDIGTALLVVLTGTAMMVFGRAQFQHVVVGLFLPVALLSWLIDRDPFAMGRLMAFFARDPASPVDVPTFFLALKGGGWLGAGLGNGHWARYFFPDAADGLVTAVIGEELGFVGLLGVIGCYLAMLGSGVYIGAKAPDRFGALLGYGIVVALIAQVVLNVLVVAALLPLRALPLPLVSRGGFSLCVPLVGVGVLWSIANACGENRPEAESAEMDDGRPPPPSQKDRNALA